MDAVRKHLIFSNEGTSKTCVNCTTIVAIKNLKLLQSTAKAVISHYTVSCYYAIHRLSNISNFNEYTLLKWHHTSIIYVQISGQNLATFMQYLETIMIYQNTYFSMGHAIMKTYVITMKTEVLLKGSRNTVTDNNVLEHITKLLQ